MGLDFLSYTAEDFRGAPPARGLSRMQRIGSTAEAPLEPPMTLPPGSELIPSWNGIAADGCRIGKRGRRHNQLHSVSPTACLRHCSRNGETNSPGLPPSRHLTSNANALRRRWIRALAPNSSKIPRIATFLEEALIRFDGQRYHLHAWCVMPTHVHVLVSPKDGCTLSEILHSWKSFTAKAANRALGRKGSFWAEERSSDRAIRDDVHYRTAHAYIVNNPVKAGLCASPEDSLSAAPDTALGPPAYALDHNERRSL